MTDARTDANASTDRGDDGRYGTIENADEIIIYGAENRAARVSSDAVVALSAAQ